MMCVNRKIKTIVINGAVFKTVYKPLETHKRVRSTTVAGNGKVVPSVNCVKYNGRLRRIYCTVYGNTGKSFINVNGKPLQVW